MLRFALTAIRKEFLSEKEGESKRKRTRERVRERERERSTQFGEGSINGPTNRGRVGLTLKLDELL